MINYSCDLCGKSLNPDNEKRYVVNIDISPVEPEHSSLYIDSDIDPIELLEQIIESSGDSFQIEQDCRQTRRFDLCCDCHKKFAFDPLGSKTRKKISFSSN